MRWTLTSPDGIGDFLLRLPWLKFAEKAGWQLQLVAREPTIEVARLANLRAEFVSIRLNPYGKAARGEIFPFRREIRAVHRFKPELVFFGPSNPSFLEEQFAEWLAPPKLGGFRLSSKFWPSEGIQDPSDLCSRYNFSVDVGPQDHDFVRNAKAVAYFFGLTDTQNLIKPPHLSLGRQGSLPGNLKSDEYIVTCPGYRSGDYFLGWGNENWLRELKHLQNLTRMPYVFVGSEGEARANAEIVAGLDNSYDNINLTSKIKSIRELAEVLGNSCCYVGKDTGSMHLAAALRKPIVAVFGGGTWGRFLPVGTKSVVLTNHVPCRGCDWRCHLSEPACVRTLPSGCLSEAFNKLARLGEEERCVIEFSATAEPGIIDVAHDGHAEKQHQQRKMILREERRKLLARPWARVYSSFLALIFGLPNKRTGHVE